MLADLLFPEIKESIEDITKKYPKRPNGQTITRMGPSPTGFVHIGNVYSAMLDDIFGHKDNGINFLRIEDTDQKREVEGAKNKIVDIMKKFGLIFDEGPIGANYTDLGDYGPYIQSQREYIYKVFAKHLLSEGKAYPCFMTEEELAEIREHQTIGRQVSGVYGSFSKWRNATEEEIKNELETKKEFVVRFKSPGKIGDRVVVNDMIKGDVETNDNFLDIVILKKTGIPTYHFAHLVDDYLMGTTHVFRSDEWFASLPLHLQLFKAFNYTPPRYIHYAPLIKLDNGNKRKLSKRKDLEADVEYYFKLGYPIIAIIDYLANIINAGYEDWRKENTKKSFKDYDFKIEKMSQAGALVDMEKLDFVSKEYIANLGIEELFNEFTNWANKYDNELMKLININIDYTKQALNIERELEKPPKRFCKMSDIPSQLTFFFDEIYKNLDINFQELIPNIKKEHISKFLANYKEYYNLNQSKEEWFSQLKEIAVNSSFAINNKEFIEGTHIGKIGDAAMILRVVLCGQRNTPDLYETMQTMGKQRVDTRINKFI
ncbi:MAG: glutamate--tRNA ligase [Candidatus Gracilibacteria bacterium]|nr:glutamate--tRNA ligase [Candidatus Gracilibacteria bacterium]